MMGVAIFAHGPLLYVTLILGKRSLSSSASQLSSSFPGHS